MARIVVVTSIAAAPESVWRELADLATHDQWMADAEAIEFLSGQRTGVGTKMKVFTKVGPLTTNDIITVTEWDEPLRIAVDHSGLVTGTGEFRIEPDGEGASLTWDEDLTFPWYLGGFMTGAAATPVLRHIWKRNLERFKSRVEN